MLITYYLEPLQCDVLSQSVSLDVASGLEVGSGPERSL